MIASVMEDLIILSGGFAVLLVVFLAVLRTNRRDAKDVWQAPERPETEVPPPASAHSERLEWEWLEVAVQRISASAAEADRVVAEATETLDGSHPVTSHAQLVRLEVLEVKADLERQLEKLVLECLACGQRVRWVAGLDVTAGHWAHLDPAPHEPVLRPAPTA